MVWNSSSVHSYVTVGLNLLPNIVALRIRKILLYSEEEKLSNGIVENTRSSPNYFARRSNARVFASFTTSIVNGEHSKTIRFIVNIYFVLKTLSLISIRYLCRK